MNRRKLPLILMLVAGAVTCIITLIRKYSVLHSLIALFGAFVIFFFLGSVMKWTLDYFDRENENRKKRKTLGNRKRRKFNSEDNVWRVCLIPWMKPVEKNY